ncbi:MAG: hypothetical protein FWC41_13645 [Firmicutes bacterium]|nr:hypothetical protein [Bacillota bacterium]
MKKVDFLFIYETKARELENICLLKYELEKRGYSVLFINTWYYLNKAAPKIDAHVVVAFALYNNALYNFVNKYCCRIKKIINLQWEQIGTIADEKNPLSAFFIKGFPQKAVHLAWGQKISDRLLSLGVNKRNIKVTGHIGMDFLNEKLLPYYMTREKLFKLYNIPPDKKVCLFISSFTSADISFADDSEDEKLGKTDIITQNKKLSMIDFDKFIDISTLSKKYILEWIMEILKKHEDLIFIYRPHPAEYISDEFLSLTDTSENFFIISEHSVKQWILSSDIITTWYSTSLAEIFFAKKSCYILRPVNIPFEMDLGIYENAEYITNYADFETVLDSKSYHFPVNETFIREYYTQNDKLNYINACDIFEEVLKDDSYKLPVFQSFFRNLKNKIKYKLIYNRLTGFFAKLLKNRFHLFSLIYSRIYGNEYMQQMQKRNYATAEEIISIIDKIKICLENKNNIN